MPKPGAVEEPGGRGSAGDYESLRGLSEAEIKAAIDRSRAKAAAERDRAAGSGAVGSGVAGSGAVGSGAAGSATP